MVHLLKKKIVFLKKEISRCFSWLFLYKVSRHISFPCFIVYFWRKNSFFLKKKLLEVYRDSLRRVLTRKFPFRVLWFKKSTIPTVFKRSANINNHKEQINDARRQRKYRLIDVLKKNDHDRWYFAFCTRVTQCCNTEWYIIRTTVSII